MRRISLLLALVLACALSASATAQARPAKPRPADAFVSSIGVNTHLGYSDTQYRQSDVVERKLSELGVRYIRDGLSQGKPWLYDTLRSLAARGVKVDLVVGDPLRRWGSGSLADQLRLVKQELTGAVASLEGPNEFDSNPGWRPLLVDYQQRLYQAVKADPSLSRFPVVGPALWKAENSPALGDISRSVDYGNLHPYPGGNAPDANAHMRSELGRARGNSGSKRVETTETGYHNATRADGGHRPVPERVAGVYMPRLYLDYYRRGIARTFAYELLDEWPDPSHTSREASFGLLRNDFSEKPAFRATKRLIALLRDPGARFVTKRLGYSLRGAGAGVRRLLLQKRDGSYYLAIWRDASIWDATAGRRLHPRADRVRLVLHRRARRMKVYRPSKSSRALRSRSDARSLSLSVSSSVSIVRIVPRGAAARARRGRARPR